MFGSSYCPLQFLEVGDFEKMEHLNEDEDDEEEEEKAGNEEEDMSINTLPYTERQALVQVFSHSPLDKSCAYPVEFMHALRNYISHSVGYSLFGKKKYCKCPDDLYQSIYYFLDGNKPHDDIASLFQHVPEYIKKGIKESYEEFGFGDWLKVNKLLKKGEFSFLKSHDQIVFAFQLYPLIFQKSLSNPRIRVIAYTYMILDELLTIDRDLDRVEDLNNMLCILYSILEGLTPFNFSTISQHMTTHVADSIHNAGLLVLLTAFITESMYKWNKNDDIQSSNIYKTKIKRVITLVFISLYKSYSSLFDPIIISHDLKHPLIKPIWNSLFSDNNKLFILLTKHNFQDCYVFSRCDSISFVTGLDIYMENGYKLPDGFENTIFLNDSFWESTTWSTPSLFSAINYNSVMYYSIYSKKSNNNYLDSKYYCYLRTFDNKLQLFLIAAFLSITIQGKDFIQVICYHVPTKSIFETVDSPSIRCISKEVLKNYEILPKCLIPIDRLYMSRGKFFISEEKDDVFFIPNKLVVKHAPLFHSRTIYDDIVI